MRIMAIDYGDVRTGVAFSDPSGQFIGDVLTITERNKKKLTAALLTEITARGVSKIVVGNPINMNGTAGERSDKSKAFAEMLTQQSGLEADMWDERLTSVDAHRILHEAGRHGKENKTRVDSVAAALILEGYIMYLNNKNKGESL